MDIYQSRQEHDLYKLLAKNLKELSKSVEGKKEAEEKVKEIVALIDGYFLTSRKRVREEDI